MKMFMVLSSVSARVHMVYLKNVEQRYVDADGPCQQTVSCCHLLLIYYSAYKGESA